MAIPAVGCATVDPAPRSGAVTHDLGLGLSGGVVTDEDDAESRFTTPGPMVGLDATYRHGFIGATQALHVHGEGRAVRVTSYSAFNVHYLAEFGLGLRLGVLAGTPSRTRPAFSWAVAFSFALPFALSPEWTLLPFARPGFRVLKDARGNSDLRMIGEFGVTLRWTYGRF